MTRRLAWFANAAALALSLAAIWRIPVWSRDALLHPRRRPAPGEPASRHENVRFQGEGVVLEGWRFPAEGRRRGLVVYLHGFNDDRREGAGVARKFTPAGFDVIAYDSRAHGQSGGDACTYGALEKKDLARILDGEPPGPVALIGGSLGAAVALQAAAEDPRISLAVAIGSYSDLRTLAIHRAPFFETRSQVEEALQLAEEEAGFRIEDASPLAAAPRIRCRVLLVHGLSDRLTPPDHSRRIHAALVCDKELVLEAELGHYDAVSADVWNRIEAAVRAIAPGDPDASEPQKALRESGLAGSGSGR